MISLSRGGDELADALMWVCLKADYKFLRSDSAIIYDSLNDLLEASIITFPPSSYLTSFPLLECNLLTLLCSQGDSANIDGYLINALYGLTAQFKNVTVTHSLSPFLFRYFCSSAD